MSSSSAQPSTTRPLTARSVVASTLLGTDPPTLPVAFLVRTGALFGLAEGAVRTALSRMVAAGEATADGAGHYSLSGGLVERQAQQRRARAAATVEWSGRWRLAVVVSGARPADERAELRRAMKGLRLAELREGVWMRPDNLERRADEPFLGGTHEGGPSRHHVAAGTSCRWFSVVADGNLDQGDEDLVAQLWDVESWAGRAMSLRRRLHDLAGSLEAGDMTALAPGFVLSAEVLRHFVADPLLPRELLPRRWPGEALRREYDDYDAAYRRLLATWTRIAAGTPAATVHSREHA